jgi:hypothetical protein
MLLWNLKNKFLLHFDYLIELQDSLQELSDYIKSKGTKIKKGL